jgi:hypothetical protein
MKKFGWVVVLLLVCSGRPSAAQESPFVPPEVYRLLSGEISGDIAYDHLRHLTLYHSPHGGSQGFRDKLRWIEARAREFGLEDVRVFDDLKYDGVSWTPKAASLHIVSPEYRLLADFREAAVVLADYSRSGTWEGELVDVGAGTAESDYQGKDVKNKIVLATGSPAAVMDQAVWKRGALGIVYYSPARAMINPDQIPWTRIPARARDGQQPTFAFSVSYRLGTELKQRLTARPRPPAITGSESEGTLPGEKIVLRAVVEAEFAEQATQWIVEGWIRGTDPALPAIVLTAHGQEEKYSANDDNSGCANLLEIGRTLVKLIREGKLPRPRRSIRFWWVNEISAPYEYFARFPEERARILVNINQDMVGAKQSAGSRIQHITRTPWSRPSFLNTVVGSIATSVMRGNTAYLAAGQAGSRTPYSRPILSKLGTRERYGAEIVPHFNNTDHMVFNDSIVGIPGVTLTNWPDEFIHSSDDDLWQMDPTQLQRNAFIVAASAWYLATLAPDGVPGLAVQVRADAQRFLSEAFSRATERLAQGLSASGDRAALYADCLNLLEAATRKATADVDSVRSLTTDPRTLSQLDSMRNAIAAQGRALLDQLMEQYRTLTAQPPPKLESTPDIEKEVAAKVPEVAVSVREYLEKRRAVRPAGLHGVMAYEVWNFVDGKRSYLDIFRAVRAEAQFAGEWYYGTVTAKAVADLLDRGVKEGILKLK